MTTEALNLLLIVVLPAVGMGVLVWFLGSKTAIEHIQSLIGHCKEETSRGGGIPIWLLIWHGSMSVSFQLPPPPPLDTFDE